MPNEHTLLIFFGARTEAEHCKPFRTEALSSIGSILIGNISIVYSWMALSVRP